MKLSLVSNTRLPVTLSKENLRQSFHAGLINELAGAVGVPCDTQIRPLHEAVASDSHGLCGGTSCSRALGFSRDEVDRFLDESRSLVKNDKRLFDANKAILETLAGSFKHENVLIGADNRLGLRDFYLWDNWSATHNGRYYRFALQSPKVFPNDFRPDFPDDFGLPADFVYTGAPAPKNFDRGHLSEIGFFTSDNGVDWHYNGLAVRKSQNPEAFDSHAIWSGGATDVEGRLVVPYTGLSRVTNPITKEKELQRIGIAVLNDQTGAFEKISPDAVLDPLEKNADGEIIAEKLGYDIYDDPVVISAWRDPYIYVNEAKGEMHMFFGAKANKAQIAAKLPGSNGNAAVGHAVAKIGHLDEWTLLPPVDLPAAYSQFELPIVIRPNNEYVMFTSVVDLGPNLRKESVRAYRSPTLAGPWTKIKGIDDLLVDHSDSHYSLTVTKDKNGVDYLAGAFFKDDLTMTPLVKLEWGADGVPIVPR